jgi:hypothetical protein
VFVGDDDSGEAEWLVTMNEVIRVQNEEAERRAKRRG